MKAQLEIYALPEFEKTAKKIWPKKPLIAINREIAQNFYKAIPLGKGLYKLRLPIEGKGKSGGARVIFLTITKDREILLLTAFKKAEKENLTKKQLNELAELGKEILENGEWL
tara:strand:- start:1222 stop:1560 length:339 start_codon:yes stop_codon:yes gene_type:complete